MKTIIFHIYHSFNYPTSQSIIFNFMKAFKIILLSIVGFWLPSKRILYSQFSDPVIHSNGFQPICFLSPWNCSWLCYKNNFFVIFTSWIPWFCICSFLLSRESFYASQHHSSSSILAALLFSEIQASSKPNFTHGGNFHFFSNIIVLRGLQKFKTFFGEELNGVNKF